jgi:hypothetical protein
MDEAAKKALLEDIKAWWRDALAKNHKANTLKLASVDELSINPFLWSYLAYFFRGNAKAESLAEVLVYPRILGASITTSFGMGFQSMVTKLFKDIAGSTTSGMDIEFIDKTDGRTKYCQLKAGPNVINRDGVATIKGHFRSAINLARQNGLPIQHDDYVFCLLYGEPWQKNSFIKEVEEDYTVYIGKEFWHHFTGDEDFYTDLITSIGEIANEYNMEATIKEVVTDLAQDIKAKYPEIVE